MQSLSPQPVIAARSVSIRRGNHLAVQNLNWQVFPGEHWAVLGPNGAGKTSLMLMLATSLHPATGEVDLLGERLGLCDVFELRTMIGLSSAGNAELINQTERVFDVVRSAAHGMTGSWREEYDDADNERASRLLQHWGAGELAQREFGTLSEGEKKRVLIARALMSDPELLLLDEPAAGLDLSARESLLRLLDAHRHTDHAPVTVLVTHHVDEIPSSTTHVMLLKAGRVVALGPVNEALTSQSLSDTFGISLELIVRDGTFGRRWTALPK